MTIVSDFDYKHTGECKKSIKIIHLMDAKIRALRGNSAMFSVTSFTGRILH